MGKKNIIGTMKHRVTFQEYVLTDDGAGGAIEQWKDKFTTWAAKKSLRSTNILEQNQTLLKTVVKFTIRWYKNRIISNKMRIKLYNNEIYSVTSVVERNDDKRYYEINAVKEDA